MANKKEPQYYTIIFEKFIDIITETDRYYYMVADQIKELVVKQPMDSWDDSPIPDFMDTYVIVNSLRSFLDKKMNDPTEEEIKFCSKNNIKDVLMTKEDLVMLETYVISVENQKAMLQSLYGFNHAVN